MHREGKATVTLTAVFVVVVLATTYTFLPADYRWVEVIVTLLAIALMGIVLNFFRNPLVTPATNPAHVLAPCDGKVVLIQEILDTRYFQRPMRQVSIFMSPLNVHVNRVPIRGEVVHSEYKPGKYLVAWHPKSSELNEHSYFVVKNDHGEVAFKQIAGALARRICYYIKPGDRVEQGQEFGFIKFGSRCDIIFPLEWEVACQIGQLTKAGVSQVARITSNI